MTALVGYTGFVGSNIYAAADGAIGGAYDSKNIESAYGTRPDLLIYAGLRAEKYLAENDPGRDMGAVIQAEGNIAKIAPERLILISTVDVFKVPKGVDERTAVDTEGLSAYGYNRYQLELWVRERYPDALVIRLPGLFGKNIKKNFIYDLIQEIPFMLKKETFDELSDKDPGIRRYYVLQDNGFYKVNVPEKEKEGLRARFRKLGFSAVGFTDSRSRFQFYGLAHLWEDMQKVLDAGIKLWHPATEPISAGGLYRYLTGTELKDGAKGIPADYDIRTIYADVFGKKGGYISDKETVMGEIADFVKAEKARGRG